MATMEGNMFPSQTSRSDSSTSEVVEQPVADIEAPNWLKDEPPWLRDETVEGSNVLSFEDSNGFTDSNGLITDSNGLINISYIDFPVNPLLCMSTTTDRDEEDEKSKQAVLFDFQSSLQDLDITFGDDSLVDFQHPCWKENSNDESINETREAEPNASVLDVKEEANMKTGHCVFPQMESSEGSVNNKISDCIGVENVLKDKLDDQLISVDDTFKDCLALDLQDLAPLDNLNQSVGVDSFSSYHQDIGKLPPLVSPTTQFNYRPTPTRIPPFCQTTRAPLLMVNSPSFTSLPLETSSPLTSYIFNNKSLPEKNRPNIQKSFMMPNMNVGDTTMPIDQSPLDCNAVLSLDDFSNLHWKSPAAKTRAARKRRMAKNRLPSQKLVPELQTIRKPMGWSSSFLCNSNRNIPKNVPEKEPQPISPTLNKKIGPDARLRFLLQKELKPSDVGPLGRIVLPKRDAEAHLPDLNAREGISLLMEDLKDSRVWNLRFRFWPNNKSRMYLLENTRDFVKTHRLQEGDLLMIYKDDHSGKFVIRAKKVNHVDNMVNTCGEDLEVANSNVDQTIPQDKNKSKMVSTHDSTKDLFEEPSVEELINGLEEAPKSNDEDTNDVPIEDMFDLEEITGCNE